MQSESSTAERDGGMVKIPKSVDSSNSETSDASQKRSLNALTFQKVTEPRMATIKIDIFPEILQVQIFFIFFQKVIKDRLAHNKDGKSTIADNLSNCLESNL